MLHEHLGRSCLKLKLSKISNDLEDLSSEYTVYHVHSGTDSHQL